MMNLFHLFDKASTISVPESHGFHKSHLRCSGFVNNHGICMVGGMIVAFVNMRYYLSVIIQKEG
jgi:hypothetical protein